MKMLQKEEESERVSGLLFRTRWQSQYQGRVVDSKVVYTYVFVVRFSSAILDFLTIETSPFLYGSQLTPSSFTRCSLRQVRIRPLGLYSQHFIFFLTHEWVH